MTDQEEKDVEEKPSECLGLLECPLRKGFIEFAYSPGDLVSDLKQKVQEKWGRAEMFGSERRYFWDASA